MGKPVVQTEPLHAGPVAQRTCCRGNPRRNLSRGVLHDIHSWLCTVGLLVNCIQSVVEFIARGRTAHHLTCSALAFCGVTEICIRERPVSCGSSAKVLNVSEGGVLKGYPRFAIRSKIAILECMTLHHLLTRLVFLVVVCGVATADIVDTKL
jgi:hypothetical protein